MTSRRAARSGHSPGTSHAQNLCTFGAIQEIKNFLRALPRSDVGRIRDKEAGRTADRAIPRGTFCTLVDE